MNVLTGLWKKLINNIGLKIISLFAGLLIWIVVVGIDNPLKTQIFTGIPVNVENASVMEDAGKAYEVAESNKTVSISVRAERSILNRLSRDNFTASIDLENYSDGKVPINVKANRYADKITSITPRTAYATVLVEDLGQKQFGIEAEITGELPEGYSVGNVVVNNNIVRVSGPESIVDSIERAVVEVSVQGMTRDIRTESAIRFYDSNADAVNIGDLELSRTDSEVTVEIWKNKNVAVTYNYTGIPAEGFAATGNIMASINDIDITGARADLNAVEVIDIPGTAIDITGAGSNVNVKVDIADYLPEGISIVGEGDEDTVSDVAVEIQPLGEINVEVPISNITVENVPHGMSALVGGPGETVLVSVKGLAATLSNINPAMITGRVDLSQVALEQNIVEWTDGVYDAAVTFTYPEGIYSGNTVAYVKVIVRSEDSVSPDNITEDGAQ